LSFLAPAFDLLDRHPRRALTLIAAGCIGLLAFGMYLQHVVGLEPCPMCIVQRYALILVAMVAGIAALISGAKGRSFGILLMGALAVGGAFVAARQSFLQWYCSAIDWTFLGLSIANWSFLCFTGIAALATLLLLRRQKA
jgi:protein dithiol:quinone oxidoreductase